MDSAWIGRRVSLNCGPLGFYQGIVKSIQLGESTITIRDVFQNGVSSTQAHVTLRSQDIKNIKVLKSTTECSNSHSSVKDELSKSVVTVTTTKKPPQTIRNNNNTSSNHRSFVADNLMARSINNNGSNNSSRYHNLRKSRDEECFGNNSFDMDEEFDFEKNLALFDKRMIFNELDEKLRSSPKTNNGDSSKYRNDENVLPSSPPQYRIIKTKNSTSEYVTDSGIMIPSINLENRIRLHESLDNFKISWEKIIELFSRATADIVLQTLGASHRLVPSNTHQIPTAVILCGRGKIGSYGLAIARLLCSHGVKTIVYVPYMYSDQPNFNSELKLYELFDQQCTLSTKDLPQEHSEIDVVINALESFDTSSEEKHQTWYKKACQWVNSKVDPRTPIVSIDPPPQQQRGPSFKHSSKITIVPGFLPFPFLDKEGGKLYMVNIGIPDLIFKNAGIKFSSPYGAKSAIQLYRK
ncbi:enhancer of mRNA-decapping protein 3 [Lepeophtheirus salmonis]|nr:enhancer of mRNA-decapping protein 3-like [Lepeophtheirus salmonis]